GSVCVCVPSHVFISKTLLCEYLQERRGVAVPPLEHLPDDGQKVPDALGLPAPQGPQQTRPLCCSRGLRGGQVHGVHITAQGSHTHRDTQSHTHTHTHTHTPPLLQPRAPWRTGT